MSCTISLPESSVISNIKTLSENDTQAISIILNACDNNFNLTDSFKEWYKTEHPYSKAIPNNISDIAKNRGKQFANDFLKYYNETNNNPIINNNRNRFIDRTAIFNYTNSIQRQIGIDCLSTFLLRKYKKALSENQQLTLEDYKKELQKSTYEQILFRLLDDGTFIDLKEVVKHASAISKLSDVSEQIKYLENLIGEKKLNTELFQNWMALYKEITSPEYSDKVLRDALRNKKCFPIVQSLDTNIKETKEEESVTETEGEVTGEYVEESNDEANEFDGTINAYEHSGILRSNVSHLSDSLRLYFDTLIKQETPYINLPAVNPTQCTKNSYGMFQYMSAEECCNVLQNIRFTDVGDFISKIEEIGNNIRGYGAFAKMANDLRNDPMLAIECATVFLKPKVGKVQLNINGNSAELGSSNRLSNREYVFRQQIYSDVASGIDHVDIQTLRTKLDTLWDRINKLENDNSTECNSIIEDIVELYKALLPSLQKGAIYSYIDKNINTVALRKGETNKKRNIANVLALLDNKVNRNKSYIVALEQANSEESKRKTSNDKAIGENKALIKEYGGLWNVPQGKIKQLNFNLKFNAEAFWMKVNEMFSDYSVILTNLSNPNIEGQNASDIVNASWVTQLSDMLNKGTDKEVLSWANDKFTITDENGNKHIKSQYKYIPFLFKQNEYKNNYVLFDVDSNNNVVFHVASNGKSIRNTVFLAQLLNGINNANTAVGITYSKMTALDSLAFKFNSYFNNITDTAIAPEALDSMKNSQSNVIQYTNYFLRTPSDATNIFTVFGPKAALGDAFIYDYKQMDNNIQQAVEHQCPIINERALNTPELQQFASNFKNKFGSQNSYIPLINSSSDFEYLDKINKEVLRNNGNILKAEENQKYQEAYVRFLTRDGYVLYTKIRIRNSGTNQENYAIVKKEVLAVLNTKYDVITDNGRIVNLPKDKDINELPQSIRKLVSKSIENKFRNLLPVRDLSVTNPITKEKRTFKKMGFIANNTEGNDASFNTIFNIFKQEMLNGAEALNHYVELVPDYTYDENGEKIHDENGNFVLSKDRYIVKRDENGNIIFKQGVDVTKGYKNYHIKGKAAIESNAETGYRLTGNVFHSSIFSVNTTDENGNIITKNPLEELIKHDNEESAGDIDFLSYGGGITYSLNADGTIADIHFTEAQVQAITEKLTEWGNYYYQKKINEITSLDKNFLPGINLDFNTEEGSTTMNTIKNYAMDTFAMHNVYDVLLGGNPKFYINNQDCFKREKQTEGAGIPYGISNRGLNNFLQIGDTTVSLQQYLNQNGITGIFSDVEFSPTFRAVTITNSIQTRNQVLMPIYEALVKNGMNKVKAAELLYGEIIKDDKGNPIIKNGGFVSNRGGFSNTKVNDAQSYITIQEFVRRIAGRGQLAKYIPLLKKLQDPNADITNEDLSAFVQVQKNFYFDLHYDPRYGIEVPRQIKNAEFVLIPQLIKGTQLETVYNLMRDNNIQQLNTVETSKASNEELLTLWDNEGNLPSANIEAFNNAIQSDPYLVQDYNYNYLYTQQDNPQHMNATNKMSVQIVKKIFDNIPEDTNHPLYKAKQEFFRIVNTNVKESACDLMVEFGIPHDSNGNVILQDGVIQINNEHVAELLKNEMLRTGCNANMISCVTINDEGEFEMIPYLSPTIDKFESVIQSSYTNNITRQKLHGFHVAQVTNIGWNSINEDLPNFTREQLNKNELFKQFKKIMTPTFLKNGKLSENSKVLFKQWLDTNNPIPSYAKNLKYHPVKENGSNVEGYIEVIVPYSYLGIDRHSTHYNNMTDEEILTELGEEKLLDFIGYRIPTEGKQSISHMKVVGFLDSAYGSTMIVPNEWVGQTGSDFDYDSIYGIQYETRFDRDGVCRRVAYKTENFDEYDYFNYINRRFPRNEQLDRNLDLTKEDLTSFRDAINSLRSEKTAIYSEENDEIEPIMDLESQAYHNLSSASQRLIKKEHKAIKEASRKDGVTNRQMFIESTKDIIDYINNDLDMDYKSTYNLESKTLSKKELRQNKRNREAVEKDIQDGNFQKFLEIQNQILETLEKYENNQNEQQNRIDDVNNQIEEIKEQKNSFIESKKQERLKKFELLAEKAGLPSFEEWKSLPTEEKNTKKQRNSQIVEDMLTVIDDVSSLEETVVRSKFDHITIEKNKLSSPNVLAERKGRSVYDTEDQGRFQEDANAGKQLKGMSVDADGLCSICGTVKPTLTRPIKIAYRPSNDYNYTASELNARFGNAIENNGLILVSHDKYGWSFDNRAVSGELLTSYSSETTAYILDAVKEGSLPNVNTNTFMVWKTLMNVGSDYHTSLAFMMQPAMTRLTNTMNKTNSIFATFKPDAVVQTIKDIANELGITDVRKKSLNTILKELNEKYKDRFNEIYNIDSTPLTISARGKLTDRYTIRVDLLEDRIFDRGIFGESSPVGERNTNKLLFDLANILLYKNINAKAGIISSIGRCLKTDKFNQKPTPFAVRQQFQNIRDRIANEEVTHREDDTEDIMPEEQMDRDSDVAEETNQENNNTGVEENDLFESNEESDTDRLVKERKPLLEKNGKHILATVYPGMDNINLDNDELLNDILSIDRSSESTYPSLYSFFRNNNCLSMFINKSIFETQSEAFVSNVNNITIVFSDKNNRLDEKTYKSVQKYIIANMASNVQFIKFPVQNIYFNEGRLFVDVNTEANEYDELSRIYGYSTLKSKADLNNLFKDITSPTGEELSKWYTLTPAEKVHFIKTSPNFANKGIFDYIGVNFNIDPKFRNRKNEGVQALKFKKYDGISDDILFNEFSKMLHSDNVLLASTALDVLKYAVAIEGLNKTSTGMTQTIDFEALYDGIIDSTNKTFKEQVQDMMSVKTGRSNKVDTGLNIMQIYENYLRSHPNTYQINSINVNNPNYSDIRNYKLNSVGGMYFIKNDTNLMDTENKFEKLLAKYKIAYRSEVTNDYRLNSYIRIGQGKNTVLYRIKQLSNGILLYPLTNLEVNEQSLYSINNENNMTFAKEQIFTKVAYESMASEYESQQEKADIEKVMRESLNQIDESYLKNKNQKVVSLSLLEETGNYEAKALKKKIQDYAKNNDSKPLFTKSIILQNFIVKDGIKNGINIKVDNNLYRVYELDYNSKQTLSRIAYRTINNEIVDVNNLLERTNTVMSPSLQEILDRAINRKNTNFDKVYEIEKISDDNNKTKLFASDKVEEFNASYMEDVEADEQQLNVNNDMSSKTLTDLISNSFDFLTVQRNEDYKNAIFLLSELRNIGVTSKRSSVIGREADVMTKLTSYVEKQAQDILREINYFIADPSDTTGTTKLSMFDEKTLDTLKDNPKLFNTFLNAINRINGFINSFDDFRQLIDETSNVELKARLNRIAKAVNSVKEINIDALVTTANKVLASKSKNVLIQQQILDILDGYWKTYGLMWQFNDIMENGTPLVQIVLKDVMSDIDAKNKMAAIKKREFVQHVKEIQRLAKENGETIDFNKIVDKYGRFIQAYTPKLIEDFYRLKRERTETEINHGYGSIEWLKSNFKFIRFKANNFNQEVIPEYYEQLHKLYAQMIFGTNDINNIDYSKTGRYATLLGNYFKYKKEYYEYISSINLDNLTKEEANKLEYLNEKMQLRHEFLTEDETVAWKAFMKQFNDIYGKYYGEKVDADFENIFNKQLEIIAKAEKRDANGVPQALQEDLLNNKEYQNARKWISRNSKFSFIDNRIVKDEYGEHSEQKEYSVESLLQLHFSLNKFNTPKRVGSYIGTIRRREGYVDEHGKLIATKLSDDDITEIKKRQLQSYYKLQDSSDPKRYENQDTRLINSTGGKTKSFSKWFYDRIRQKGDSRRDAEYYKTVTEINEITSKYYDNSDQIIHFERIQDTIEGREELKKLADLYAKLKTLDYSAKCEAFKALSNEDKKVTIDSKKLLHAVMKFKRNDTAWAHNADGLDLKSKAYRDLYMQVVGDTEIDTETGERVLKTYYEKKTGRKMLAANPYIFYHMELKDSSEIDEDVAKMWLGKDATVEDLINKIEDKERQRELEVYNLVYRQTPTVYYEQEAARARQLSDEDYKIWYNKNHIYNPYTKRIEPIACWVTTEVRPENLQVTGDARYKVTPSGRMIKAHVFDGTIKNLRWFMNYNDILDDYDENAAYPDMRNHNYKPNESPFENYNGNPEYATNQNLNTYEQQMKDYLIETLNKEAVTQTAKNYFGKGFLPKSMKAKGFTFKEGLKEAGKFVGFNTHSIVSSDDNWERELGYEKDYEQPMPMIGQLNTKETVQLEQEIHKLRQQRKELTDTKEILDMDELIKEKSQQLKDMRADLLNKDWISVIEGFIGQASNYNAIQDNKQKLYYLLKMLKQYKMYSKSKGFTGDLSMNRKKSNKKNDDIVYNKELDKELITQYETQIRRLLFNQWKESDGWLRNVMDNLQGFTSANYMMLNVKGGIANVTVGLNSMFLEAAAGEYVGKSDLSFGFKEYNKGILGYIKDMFKGADVAASNKQSAIINFFNVVDYDEIEGVAIRGKDMHRVSKNIRDAMFGPQTMGEHFMQNTILFSMLKSHKLITRTDGTSEIMSFEDYINYKAQDYVYCNLLTDEQRKEYRQFVKEIKEDKNKLEKYATYKRDLMTDFLYLKCKNVDYTDYIQKKKENRQQLKEEFDKETDIYNQLSMENGFLTFVQGSKLEALNAHKREDGVTDAIRLLGEFSEKVRKVNNKIHGVYNRMGAAHIESKWWGSLVMQYHKHLPMGLLKRYRLRGYFNETRGTVEKGFVATLKTLANLNYEKIAIDNGLNPNEKTALEAFGYSLVHIGTFLKQFQTTYKMCPEYERANMRRQLTEAIEILAAMLLSLGLLWLGDDDDDSLPYNLAIYEADRLISETSLYSPYGLLSESKKLMSTPIAALSITNDALKTVTELASIMTNPDFTTEYQAGMYAGENRFLVYLQRRIPAYSTVHSLINIDKNNKYYKVSKNLGGLVNLKALAESLK